MMLTSQKLHCVTCNNYKIGWDKKGNQDEKYPLTHPQLVRQVQININLTGHLIGCDKKSEIVRYFQGRLCDKIGLLCDKLCDFFRGNLHCFTRFQRRKTTKMLFNRQF